MFISILNIISIFHFQLQYLNAQTCSNYDASRYICCNGKLNDRIGIQPECCGDQVFDTHFKMCCNGNIRDKAGIALPACCNNDIYDALYLIISL